MRERNNHLTGGALGDKRLLDASETCYYLGLGRNKGIEFAKSIGAERKIGRRCMYDRKALDDYFDKQMEV